VAVVRLRDAAVFAALAARVLRAVFGRRLLAVDRDALRLLSGVVPDAFAGAAGDGGAVSGVVSFTVWRAACAVASGATSDVLRGGVALGAASVPVLLVSLPSRVWRGASSRWVAMVLLRSRFVFPLADSSRCS
jgi:hypothetical protein